MMDIILLHISFNTLGVEIYHAHDFKSTILHVFYIPHMIAKLQETELSTLGYPCT